MHDSLLQEVCFKEIKKVSYYYHIVEIVELNCRNRFKKIRRNYLELLRKNWKKIQKKAQNPTARSLLISEKREVQDIAEPWEDWSIVLNMEGSLKDMMEFPHLPAPKEVGLSGRKRALANPEEDKGIQRYPTR